MASITVEKRVNNFLRLTLKGCTFVQVGDQVKLSVSFDNDYTITLDKLTSMEELVETRGGRDNKHKIVKNGNRVQIVMKNQNFLDEGVYPLVEGDEDYGIFEKLNN